MPRIPWFQRKFSFPEPVEIHVDVLSRLRGAPARLDEAVAGLTSALLTTRFDGEWSIQENVGHLGDLEPLWAGRLEDFLAGSSDLRPADLANTATHEAGHNAAPVATLCDRFREARLAFVAHLEELGEEDFARTALHPRLKQPMRLLDHCLFVAAHDDCHLARIHELSRRG